MPDWTVSSRRDAQNFGSKFCQRRGITRLDGRRQDQRNKLCLARVLVAQIRPLQVAQPKEGRGEILSLSDPEGPFFIQTTRYCNLSLFHCFTVQTKLSLQILIIENKQLMHFGWSLPGPQVPILATGVPFRAQQGPSKKQEGPFESKLGEKRQVFIFGEGFTRPGGPSMTYFTQEPSQELRLRCWSNHNVRTKLLKGN